MVVDNQVPFCPMCRVTALEGMIKKLVHDYDHPSDETYPTTLASAAQLVGGS